MKRLLLAAVVALGSGSIARAQEDLLIADFEGNGYGQWQASGEAFGAGPVQGTLPNQLPVAGFEGKGLVNSYVGGDKSQGTLTSPEFTIGRRYINFLIGGGAHAEKTCINLLVDGQVARTATGAEDERLDWETWDVEDLKGKLARIQIVDRHTGGWGHINVDQILQSDTRKQAAVVTDELYNETYRPQFHFTARKNWLNDPNGLVYYKGEYHLFFQHNPTGINWGNMTWGHAISRDLLHWEQREHALLADKMGTMFSGSAVVDWDNTAGFQKGDEKTLVAIYTAAGGTSEESKSQPFTQCIAYSNDRGRTWIKYEKNPVLKHIVGGNRDPKVLWHAPSRKWIMALYLDGSDFAFFSSPDLKDWTHLQNMTVPGCDECPDFFELPVDGNVANKKWVWTAANGKYLIGSFDGHKFAPESGPHQVDFGKHFYAVQSYSDIPESDGRRIQIAWMRGGRYPKMPFNQQMGFPCELQLRTFPEGIRMTSLPVKEIATLHAKEHAWSQQTLRPGENPLAGISGELFDIRAEVELGQAAEFGFKIRGETVAYSAKEKTLSALGTSAPLEAKDGRLKLQILVDRTSLEVFGNDGKVSLTNCFVPRQAAKGLEIYSSGGETRIVSLKVYELKSAWKAQ